MACRIWGQALPHWINGLRVDPVSKRTITTKIDTLLAAWLCNETKEIAGVEFDTHYDKILERVDFHGIAGLIYSQPSLTSRMPETLRLALRDRAIIRLIWEKNHARMLERLLPMLVGTGRPPLQFKGTALAYSLYADPAARTRGDTDILVADDTFDSSTRVLRDQGFITPMTSGGEIISIEKTFIFTDTTGLEHHIDLHRKLSNSIVLAKLFTYEELLERSVVLPGLGPAARALGMVDALLIACMHRMVHLGSPYYVNDATYFSADRLIWLYDIHLLASEFSERDWGDFLTLAKQKGLMEIAGNGLGAAQNALMTDIPADVLNKLDQTHQRETPAKYLGAQPWQQMVMNFFAIHDPGRKIQFLREVAFPPARYMRLQFAHIRPAWLPWLYCSRAFSGIWKLVRPRGGYK